MKVAFAVLMAPALWAQCSMCRTAASAQGAAAGKALDSGVLILLLPAMVLFCGVFLTAWRGGRDERP